MLLIYALFFQAAPSAKARPPRGPARASAKGPPREASQGRTEGGAIAAPLDLVLH